MKSDAYLINTARGAIVDQDSPITALEAGVISGAGLDVFPNEPEVDPRLLPLPNVILLPHMGSATFEGRIAMGTRSSPTSAPEPTATARRTRCWRGEFEG